MKDKILSLTCGVIFGVGLVISGMTNPEKVIGFLSITHDWDASLIFVMGGAILVTTPIFFLLKYQVKSLLSARITLTEIKNVDRRLVLGSAFFGVGWGLVGLCPGPAISSIAFFEPITFIFLVSMIAGILFNKYIAN
tara:strand:- start:164 stop:574 length:411 start_codon:yes stop_codon:yes gene_type:complete